MGKYSVIKDGLVYIDYGPVTMTIEARRCGSAFTEAAVAGAERALSVFDESAAYLTYLRCPVGKLPSFPSGVPLPVQKMTKSVLMLEEGDFTPLAAVAGTTSDFAVEAAADCGADYALANNGGDIAWRISDQKSMRHPYLSVGLISDINTGHTTHSLRVSSLKEIQGLATSGLGGRSLTRGIASAVTVLACNSSLADAAATAIANACWCDDPAIETCLAEEIDYATDIRGLTVTKSVGHLSKGSAELALEAGSRRAETLIAKGMISGAVLFVAGAMKVVEAEEGKNLFEVRALA